MSLLNSGIWICLLRTSLWLIPIPDAAPSPDFLQACCAPTCFLLSLRLLPLPDGSLNIPPRDSKEWDQEYDRRTSVERSNKREKQDYKLEDGRHRSTKMWYCRLYGIMMLQHLDAWEMPSIKDFQSAIHAA